VHRLRGLRSNRGHSQQTRERVAKLYRERYSDYGPTLFAEMLTKHHELAIGVETLRQWLVAEGLWIKQRKGRKHRRKRPRRGSVGELLQFDGSTHDWFEGRGPACCLLVAIDDASSRVWMRFAKSENTHDVMACLMGYIERWGIPQAFYSDGGTVYYADSGVATDCARALAELGITMIRAHSPQAKGRVERSNRTQQDRLIKAMRRANITSIDEANRFLDAGYLDEHNQQFAHTENLSDVHRSAEGIDLPSIFCFRLRRVVYNDFTVRLASQFLQLLKSDAALPAPAQHVELRRYLDDSLHIFWQDREIPFTLFQQRPANVARLPRPPKPDHPWRKTSDRMLKKKKNCCSVRKQLRQRQQQKRAASEPRSD